MEEGQIWITTRQSQCLYGSVVNDHLEEERENDKKM